MKILREYGGWTIRRGPRNYTSDTIINAFRLMWAETHIDYRRYKFLEHTSPVSWKMPRR